MSLSARRRKADLAAARAQTSARSYRQSAERLQSRLRHDWKLPLAFGLGTGAMAGLVPLAATVRAGSALVRLAMSLSRVPYGALARLARNASGANETGTD